MAESSLFLPYKLLFPAGKEHFLSSEEHFLHGKELFFPDERHFPHGKEYFLACERHFLHIKGLLRHRKRRETVGQVLYKWVVVACGDRSPKPLALKQ